MGKLNLELIHNAILNSGYKKSYIAMRIGVKRGTLTSKLNGSSEFKISELAELCNLLKLNINDIWR